MGSVERKWNSLMEYLGIPYKDYWLPWSQLEVLYSSPDRHYHTFKHLNDFYKKYRFYVPNSAKSTAFQLAIFYHDAVYDTHSTNNEERSADLAEEALTNMKISKEVIKSVKALIFETKAYKPQGDGVSGSACAYFLDCDLSILGSKPQSYDLYSQGIKKEYSWICDETFSVSRHEFLTNLLTRDYIFNTQVFRNSYEEKARTNIKRELESLG